MSAQIVSVADGVVTVKVTGLLQEPELTATRRSAAAIIEKQGTVRLLVIAEKFKGWAKGGNWGDLSFEVKNDQFIERMAIVADQKWEVLAFMFAGKGLRKFPIEYFQPSDQAKALTWLAQKD